MLSSTPRPSRTASTMVAKWSSARIMRAASLVTSVPATPMATPMSAAFSAGASLTPSPVIATTLPLACSARTMRSLCLGATRANTEVFCTAAATAPFVQLVELDAGEHRRTGIDDAEIGGDAHRRARVVAGDHDHADRFGDIGASLSLH